MPKTDNAVVLAWQEITREELAPGIGRKHLRGREIMVAQILLDAGAVVVIPGDLPHGVVALEDSFVLDLFAPPRQDWIDGSDDDPRR